ncbi:restriction endonuclease subunit S [Ferrimonas balearica]|uniref:restriction endonuclease subunit S n=1 Tax=Ferrimonas balearica TaxID=44012 RepID=UPI001C5AE253|nr:restriction endonuclease subunit S [Ferrimonas balearica]MBW3166478.1 restriction endonuclease subunit S [Ferrimonas balearica]
MVPNGWSVSTLGNLADMVMGFAFKSKDFVEDGVPLVRMGNLYLNRLQLDRNPVFLPEKYLAEYERFVLQPGDLVMSMTGTMGKRDYGFTVKLPSDAPKCFLNQRVMKFIPRDKNSGDYLLYLLRSEQLLDKIYAFPGGTKQANLSAKQLKELEVTVPPSAERRKIAKVLATWDKAIATTERLIANSQQQKKALMQQLLTGKKRFDGFEGEWQEVALSDLCQRVTTRNNGQSTNVVTISAQHGLIRQEEFFKKSVASATLDNYYLLKKGQFAYNKSYSNGYPMGAIKRLKRYDDGVVTSLYICFEVTEGTNVDVDFLEHYFDSGLLNSGLTRVAAEGGRAHGLLNVKPADFMSLKLTAPGKAEQEKIARTLTVAQSEVDNLEQKLAHLKQEKQALMQQLLTGKRRVKVDEKEIA